MKASASASSKGEKKGHVCPPSNATHPRDRWESLFIYSFICKFTNLRGKSDGLNSPMDFEDALLAREPNPIMTAILSRFILNLKPGTRNVSVDQISSTLQAVLAEYFKSTERTVFWDDERKANIDPFQEMETGFFTADWDLKLKILRQLVELQLSHCPDIKSSLDRAWGVTHIKEKRKGVANSAGVPDPTDADSQDSLSLVPIGQDIARKRYWIADDSPRLYVSTNPWKMSASFQTIASTKEEYTEILEKLKASAPAESKASQKRSKLEVAHVALIKSLEERVERIDAELARIARARKKAEQRQVLLAQAEIRQTRTRRQTRRPDYTYHQDADSDDGGGTYAPQEPEEDEDYEDVNDDEDLRGNGLYGKRKGAQSDNNGLRRSSRATAQATDDWEQWRGERRSTRLGALPEMQMDGPPPKRARTEESTVSDGISVASEGTRAASKTSKPNLLKPTEKAMDQIAGKKKSKFWFYAVEPAQGVEASEAPPSSHASSVTGDGDVTMEDQDSRAPSVEAEEGDP